MLRLFRGQSKRRMLVFGLDCAGSELVFRELAHDLPHIRALMRHGTWGQLDSSIPCITVPAWASMLSGRDPGVLGIYGFRKRSDYGYEELSMADSRTVKQKRIWDYFGELGRESLIFNVPQTYPINPIRGYLLGDFLTPNTDEVFTYPAILKQEILKSAPNYTFDVRDFRKIERTQLLQNIIDMTDMQYQAFERALTTKSWDFAMHVNIGTDRMHHAFWRYHDKQHRLYEAGHPFNDAIRDYYNLVDEHIGRILSRLNGDEIVMIVSDHGVKRMDGAICINEWLWQQGFLVFKEEPIIGEIIAFDVNKVDWSKTRAWSTGGYYGRIFLNIQGREPQGIIPLEAVPSIREELTIRLQKLTDDKGQTLATTVYSPRAIYQQVNGIAPDLLVYFGNLHWRVVGGIGYGQHYTFENDTGADDANHAMEGMYLINDPKQSGRGQSYTYQLMDVASTILHMMGIDVPKDLQGKVISYH